MPTVFCVPLGRRCCKLPRGNAIPWPIARDRARTCLLTAHVERTPVQAFNVIAVSFGNRPKYRALGRDDAAQRVVVVRERARRWLGLLARNHARRRATPRLSRDVLFVASSGHELGHLGLDAFIERRPGLVTAAKAWIHLGANIGAAQGPGNNLQASDDEMESMMAEAMTGAGLRIDRACHAAPCRAAKPRTSTAAAVAISPSSETTTSFTIRTIEGPTRSI